MRLPRHSATLRSSQRQSGLILLRLRLAITDLGGEIASPSARNDGKNAMTTKSQNRGCHAPFGRSQRQDKVGEIASLRSQ